MRIRVLMENTALDPSLAAEHGLSLYIETGARTILFDAGQSAAFAGNAQKLGADLTKVDLCVLSHGHYDHSGGIAHFLKVNDHAPVYMHRHAPKPHFNASGKDIGVDPALPASGRIVFTDDALDLGGGITLCTCNEFACGCPASARGMSVLSGGAYVQDDFSHEQYLVVQENGRRIVISGCSHKGILDIVKWLQPDVLIGGFHFMKLDPHGEDSAFLEHAARQLLMRPCTYYTGHCTGEATFAFLKSRMGDALHAIPAGTVIDI